MDLSAPKLTLRIFKKSEMESHGKDETSLEAMEPTDITNIAKEPTAIEKRPTVAKKTGKKAHTMRNVTPGELLPRVIDGEFVGKIFQPLKHIDLPGLSSATGDTVNTPESMCSSAAAQSIIAPEDVSDTINTSPCRLLIGPRDKVLCCTLAIHKNKGMNMDDQQEFMHKLMFERRGKLPDRTINTTNFKVPWREFEAIMGVASQNDNGIRSARLFAYRSETKVYLEHFVEITGTRPPVVSWADKKELEKECLIRASGTNVTYTCPTHSETTHSLYHVTYWRGNKLEGY